MSRLNASRRANISNAELLELAAKCDQLQAALRAVRARIQGQYDTPELQAFGPLSTSADADCLAIIAAVQS